MISRYAFIGLLPALALAPHSWAETATLTFKNKTVETNAEPGAKQLTMVFPFENKSNETIEITKQAAACACLGATFKDDKKTYAPGEKGELTAKFKLGNFYGTVSKQVLLWQKGDANNKPSIILTTRVTIPELISLTPRTLSWDIGGESKTQTCKITVTHKKPIHITKIARTNNNFTPELKTIRDGWEYELTVTAKNTSSTSFGILKITTDSTVSRFRRTQAFVYVRRPTSKKK